MPTEIHPAILVHTDQELINQIENLLAVSNFFDIDVISWSGSAHTIPAKNALDNDLNVSLAFDLMEDYPLASIEVLLRDERVKRIIINARAKINFDDVIMMIRDAGRQVGISLNPENNLSEVAMHLEHLDVLQIMTVEPGRQGGIFLPERLDLLDQAKNMGFAGKLEIDGGITDKTIETIMQHPVDILSVGSYLSHALDPVAAFNKLMSLL